MPARSGAWKWWVCGLLLLGTMLNYMDRLTLNLTAVRIMEEFGLDTRHYGQLESVFAFAFALGAIIAGWMADRWNVRWLYPAAVLAWSAAGFATGLAQGFLGLLACRFLLGLSEAGNWPCALRTTQHILPPAQRTLGNSILQSGAAIGAIFTPLIVLYLVTGSDHRGMPGWAASAVAASAGFVQMGVPAWSAVSAWMTPIYQPGAWRAPFLVVGTLGIGWAIIWLMSVRKADLALDRPAVPPASADVLVLLWLMGLFGLDIATKVISLDHIRLPVLNVGLPLLIKAAVSVLGIAGVFGWLWHVTREDTALPRRVFFRRFWVLVGLVVSINTTWHFFRAWLPLFLQQERRYTETETSWFILAYYLATDIGSLSAGIAALAMARRGLSVHTSRVLVFLACALLTALSTVAATLPAGPMLLIVLLIIGFGALGLFPNYYSFSQELTVQHQGKLTGALGCISWLAMSLLHEVVGESVKQTKSYTQGISVAGLPPLLAVLALLLLWGTTGGHHAATEEATSGK